MIQEQSKTVKVKRDGPRGWRNIAATSFDPDVHELFDAPAENPSGNVTEMNGADQITDDQMRDAIETATGKKPHWKTRRENLIEQFHSIDGV